MKASQVPAKLTKGMSETVGYYTTKLSAACMNQRIICKYMRITSQLSQTIESKIAEHGI